MPGGPGCHAIAGGGAATHGGGMAAIGLVGTMEEAPVMEGGGGISGLGASCAAHRNGV